MMTVLSVLETYRHIVNRLYIVAIQKVEMDKIRKHKHYFTIEYSN